MVAVVVGRRMTTRRRRRRTSDGRRKGRRLGHHDSFGSGTSPFLTRREGGREGGRENGAVCLCRVGLEEDDGDLVAEEGRVASDG